MLNPIALARKAIEIGGIIPDDKEYHSLRESAPNIGSRAIFYKRRSWNRGRKGSAALDPQMMGAPSSFRRMRGTEGSNPCTLQSGYWLVAIVDWPNRAGLPGVARA